MSDLYKLNKLMKKQFRFYKKDILKSYMVNMPKNKKNEVFEITQERIDVIKKAAQYLKQTDDFPGWVDQNFYGHNVIPYYYIMEDFVKSK